MGIGAGLFFLIDRKREPVTRQCSALCLPVLRAFAELIEEGRRGPWLVIELLVTSTMQQ